MMSPVTQTATPERERREGQQARQMFTDRSEGMHDSITQTRLSLRLDGYLSAYMGKGVTKDHASSATWKAAWEAAELARTNQNLTPELIDNVRMALNKLLEGGTPP